MSDLSDDDADRGAQAVSAVGVEDRVELGWKFQIDVCFGVLGCLESLRLETNFVTMISLATDTLKVQTLQSQTFLTLASAPSDAALHIVQSIADRYQP